MNFTKLGKMFSD